MESQKLKPFSAQIQSLVETDKGFQQKLKQRLFFESSKVENPLKFLVGLFQEGVLCDGSRNLEAHFGFKEMIVQYAVSIACSKGPEAIGGMIKALDGSGNLQLISALRTWAKEDSGVETDGRLSEPKSASGMPSPATKTLLKNVTTPIASSSSGTKLIDKIVSRPEDDLVDRLQGHLVGKAAEIVNTTEFCASLVRENALKQTEIQLATGSQVQEIEKVIKAVCLKKAIGSLVVGLQSSNNERILEETYEWLENSQGRKKNYPIAVKSLANQPRPIATALFAATTKGLIVVDLQTLEATALTSRETLAVAVNHNLKKVYWSEIHCNSRIMRSNFDGSCKEVIIPQTDDGGIYALTIDEPSGNVYFAHFCSNQIRVCNAVGENCAAVKSISSLVNNTSSITLDSEKRVMYWDDSGASPQSIVRANLDGSNAAIIYTGFSALQGITLDHRSNDVIYWVDWWEYATGSIDVNGGNKRTLVKLEGKPRLEGIQVDAQKIYFNDFDGGTIQSVNRDSGKELTTIFKSTGGVFNLALLYAPVKQ